MHTDYIAVVNNYDFYIFCAYGFAAFLLGGLIAHTIIRSRKK